MRGYLIENNIQIEKITLQYAHAVWLPFKLFLDTPLLG